MLGPWDRARHGKPYRPSRARSRLETLRGGLLKQVELPPVAVANLSDQGARREMNTWNYIIFISERTNIVRELGIDLCDGFDCKHFIAKETGVNAVSGFEFVVFGGCWHLL